MESNISNLSEEDQRLFKLAKKRTAFKFNIIVFFMFNIFTWSLWLFFSKKNSENTMPWPLWPMLMWTIAIIYTYFKTYVPKNYFSHREYLKLKNSNNNF
jgi:hypothetical protein